MSDLVKRLEDEEARMERLWQGIDDARDKHHGTPAAFDFNSLKHAVAGRDPVLREAAARISLLEQQLKTAREEERERCAKAIEPEGDQPSPCCAMIEFETRIWCAITIRSLGEKDGQASKAVGAE